MTTLYVTSGCYWTLPGGAVTVLERPLPGDHDTGQASPQFFSDDGSVIVGQAIDADQVTKHAARWDHGVMTLLTPLTYLGQTLLPMGCSADASVIVGGQTAWGYWTGGGTTAAILPPSPGGIMASGPVGSACSSDGHVIVGNTFGAQGTRWLNGVPTTLVDNTYLYSEVIGCSADGNTVFGNGWGSSTYNPNGQYGGYWRGPGLIWHPAAFSQYARAINANGTVVWSDAIYQGGYTDNLNTPDSTYGIYGTYHQWVPVTGSSFVRNSYYAVDTFSPNPVAAGFCYFSAPNNTSASRTKGTTTVLLDKGSFTVATTSGISGDGTIVTGAGYDATNNNFPCYWDAAGSIHTLPIPNGWDAAATVGISRNGAVIFGIVSKTIDVPIVYADPALRLVSLYPQNLPDNRFNFYADSGAHFPDSFGQYSLSMWCCEGITLRWPEWPQTVPPFGLLSATPSQCHAEFRDRSGLLLFSGTFVNPNPNPPDYYKLSFAIDTEVGTVVCYGDNTAWTSTDAVFASLGQIGNFII